MNEEVLIEEGIVTKVFNNEVEISLIETSNCDSCITKDFCKGERSKTIGLKNDHNLNVGDKVKIEVKGKTVLQTVFLLYGIPILILLLSFLIFYQMVETNKEIIASSISFFAIGIYYLMISFFLRKLQKQFKVNVIKES